MRPAHQQATPDSLLRHCLLLQGLLVLCMLAAGCRHHRVAYIPPPPPELEQPAPPPAPTAIPQQQEGRVLSTEVGIASWYSAPYRNARQADGRVYNENGFTAAHRTLPLGTVARVTNISTHQSVIVTITDRGPFVPGRMLDLSRAAALRIGVWRPGTAWVRLDVLHYPLSAEQPGRWCVQIGAIHHARTADKLRDHLKREYPRAYVIDFKGETGYWVRIRPAGGSHREAEEIASVMRPKEGDPYLVRLH